MPTGATAPLRGEAKVSLLDDGSAPGSFEIGCAGDWWFGRFVGVATSARPQYRVRLSRPSARWQQSRRWLASPHASTRWRSNYPPCGARLADLRLAHRLPTRLMTDVRSEARRMAWGTSASAARARAISDVAAAHEPCACSASAHSA